MRMPLPLPYLAALAGLSLLAACSNDFDGPEKVKDLRVLAVKATLPEIGASADGGASAGWPAERTGLATLVAHPGFAEDGEPRAVVMHLACTPTPGDVEGSACTTMSQLEDAADLFALLSLPADCAPGQGVTGAVTFSGMEACDRLGCRPLGVLRDPGDPGSTVTFTPGYALPAEYSLASLPAGHTQRVTGADVVIVSLVVEATPAELAPTAAAGDACQALQGVAQRFGDAVAQRAGVTALKWVHVRGPDMPAASPPNVNPTVAGMALGERALAPLDGAPDTEAVAKHKEDLLPVLPGDFETLRQTYQRFSPAGEYVDTKQEEWAFSWFTTAGELDHAHTNAPDDPNHFEPGAGRQALWLVVRDLRGGVDWTSGLVEAQ